MKKILLSICAVLAFTLSSCGGDESSNSESCYYYEDYNSSGSNINFKGGKKRRHCKNNPYVNHITCYEFVEDPIDARYCATCGCLATDHWYE